MKNEIKNLNISGKIVILLIGNFTSDKALFFLRFINEMKVFS